MVEIIGNYYFQMLLELLTFVMFLEVTDERADIRV